MLFALNFGISLSNTHRFSVCKRCGILVLEQCINTDSMDALFTYGALMCGEIMTEVAGMDLDGHPATLHGYARLRVRNEHYPGLVQGDSGPVDGILYRGLTRDAGDDWTVSKAKCTNAGRSKSHLPIWLSL